MEIAVDLHSHSMFAGGSGGLSTSQESLAENMKKAHKRFILADLNSKLKGLQVLGSGDIQFTPWLNFFKRDFEEEQGLFVFKTGSRDLKYCLQTEVIITAELAKNKRKSVHTIILFPHYEAIELFKTLLDNYDVKQEKITRPFIVLKNKQQVSEFLYQVKDIDDKIEVIPAHVMTPEGVYGGNDGVNNLREFFGLYAKEIQTIETGLSADPNILALIPELDDKTLLSNSDAHSAQLHRIGREFSILDLQQVTYNNIIDALRKQKIAFSLEFPVTEGRYFLTGHRSGRKKPGAHSIGQYCFFSPEHVPKDNVCPICKKSLTIGVLQRVHELCKAQGESRNLHSAQSPQNFIHGVPLTEVIASALQIKSPESKAVLKHYKEVISVFGNEVNLWRERTAKVESNLPEKLLPDIKESILLIKEGNFSFFPPGYDGTYGSLVLGKKQDIFGHAVIKT